MKKYIYILVGFVLTISACKKGPIIGGTAVEAVAGEYWVQIDGAGDYYGISTYNTADNSSTQMWLNMTNFWGSSAQTVFGKVNVNLNDKTFNGTKIANAGTYDGGITFTVTDGKITPNGTVGPSSKSPTDSIQLKVEFSDDPGNVYNLTGYRRTKFVGDDH